MHKKTLYLVKPHGVFIEADILCLAAFVTPPAFSSVKSGKAKKHPDESGQFIP
jgi:hypothetical protein